ncbi:MAG: TRAP transporter small permease subunit [Desulfopila sp.]
MKWLIHSIDRISTASGAAAALLLCLGLAMTVAEIVLRTFFDRTLYITDEYLGYLMCGITFLALSYTLKEKGHIRMTLLFGLVKGRARILLDGLCCLVGLVFAAAVTWFCTLFCWDSFVTGSQSMQISATYLAVPQFFMVLGALALTMQFVGELLKAVLAFSGDTEGLAVLDESRELGR